MAMGDADFVETVMRSIGRLGRAFRWTAFLACLALPLGAQTASSAPEVTTLFSFKDNGAGKHPWSAVVAAPDGSLFGTTTEGGSAGAGTVFQLTPPGSGQKKWKRIVLHEFLGGNDGAGPLAGLARASDGTLYGATDAGGGGECSGGCGVVYQLAPLKDGSFKYKVIYRFKKIKAGVRSSAQLVLDKAGVLYGTTRTGGAHDMGTVFSLTPEADGWTRRNLHSFAGGVNDGQFPQAGVVFGPDGALYGTTLIGGADAGSRGTVFRLARAGGSAWTATLLHRFKGGSDGEQPLASVTFGADGALYGTTSLGGGGTCFLGCGTVFRLVQDGEVWSEKVIHRFAHGADGSFPRAGLVVDKGGTLWGTTTKGGAAASLGVIYKVTPPPKDKKKWTESVVHAFVGAPNDGAVPFGGLLFDKKAGVFYGTTRDGGAGGGAGFGTVFRLDP